MSDHSTFPPRAMTPYKLFDSQSKIAAATPTRAPLEVGEGLPRIPRDPKLPTGTGFGAVFDGAPRDTEADQLQDAELGDDDETPANPESPYEMILRKLNKLERAVKDSNTGSRRSYQLLVDMNAKFDIEKTERELLAHRVRALELADRWVPRLAWLVTTAIAVLALLRTYR